MQSELIRSLNEADRRVLVLVKSYEDCRKSFGQFGYIAFRNWDSSILESPVFKQFRTVFEWMLKHGWQVGWKQVHWQGYVRFVFENLQPSIPQPGQLKNEKLLREYLLSAANVVPEGKSSLDLKSLYLKILRPEVKNSPQVLHALGF